MAATRPGPLGKKPLLIVLGAGLAAMLLASAAWRLTHPSLTIVNQRAAQEHGAAEAPAGMPPGMPGGAPGGMPGNAPAGMAGMGEMGQLMNRAKDNPRDVEALTGIAERLLMFNAPDKAMVFVDRALAEKPTDPRLMDLKAVALAGLGQDAEAADYLRAALAQDPGNAQVRFHLGMLLKHALGQPAEGDKLFQAVIDDPKADPELRNAAQVQLKAPAPEADPAAPAKP
jgi:tetratricopeptide (TPR) repeat protein